MKFYKLSFADIENLTFQQWICLLRFMDEYGRAQEKAMKVR